MSHIFISYSHKDKKYVHKLQKALQDEGFEVWIDDRIDYGDEWPTIIQRHLDDCDAFIVVLTDNAFQSKWVQNELTRASRKGKPFFPLLLKGDPWLSVEATQYVDVRNGSLPPENFYARLERVTPRKPKPAPIPPQAHPDPPPDSPVPQTQKVSGWKNAVFIPASFLVLLTAFLTVIFLLLPSVPGFSSYQNSFELTDLVMSSTPGIRPGQTEFSSGETIYLTLYLTNRQGTQGYETRWYYLVKLFDINKSLLIATQENTDPAISDSILYKHNPLYLSGNYKVDIYKEGSLIGVKYFSVR